MNYERTIGGLTKHSARQLGEAYATIAESLNLIDELSTSNALASQQIASLSMEAAGLRCANTGLKKHNQELAAENRDYRKEDEARKRVEGDVKKAFGLPADFDINAKLAIDAHDAATAYAARKCRAVTREDLGFAKSENSDETVIRPSLIVAIKPITFDIGQTVTFNNELCEVKGVRYDSENPEYFLKVVDTGREFYVLQSEIAVILANDTPCSWLDGHTPNEVRDMGTRAAAKVSSDAVAASVDCAANSFSDASEAAAKAAGTIGEAEEVMREAASEVPADAE